MAERVKVGRKPTEQLRTRAVSIMLTVSEFEMLKERAGLIPISTYIRYVLDKVMQDGRA
jgi:hypothetical protein